MLYEEKYVENAFEYMMNVRVVQSRFGAKANDLVRLQKGYEAESENYIETALLCIL